MNQEPAEGTVGNLNPFRYRGYCYDVETGFYYVSSRYYDPEVGRWLNADGYITTGQGVLSYNMYVYCLNNPVNMIDTTGGVPDHVLLENARKYEEGANILMCGYKNNKPKKNNNVPSGGKSVFKGQVRICTDGSKGDKVPDDNWLPETAYSHNGKPLDAYTVPYVVIPLKDDSAKLGDSALLINHDTNMSIMCVVGERGPADNGWGEVSIVAIWDTGHPNHMTANHSDGISENYEIILYPGVRYEWGD